MGKKKATEINTSAPRQNEAVHTSRLRRILPERLASFLNSHRRSLLFIIDLFVLLCAVLINCLFNAISVFVPMDRFLLTRWPAFAVIAVCLFLGRYICRVYRNVWRYPNVKAYIMLMVSDCAGGAVAFFINRACYRFLDGTHTFLCINVGFWQTACVVGIFCFGTLALRFIYQLTYRQMNIYEAKNFWADPRGTNSKIRVAIVGAGQVGALLADELFVSPSSHYRPVCFIEQDAAKVGGYVNGIKVYSESDDIKALIETKGIQEIFLAMPKLTPDNMNQMYEKYTETGCKVKLYSLPTGEHAEMYNAPSTKGMVRRLTPEDYVTLLGRDALLVNNDETRAFYRDRVVLVTGGGGSIGSEICRQIAKCNPRQLIIFDIYENNAYNIQMELGRLYGASLDLQVEIGSVRDLIRLEAVFAAYHPEVVFHAAAHKHVPLMEHSNCEAIKNNVMGTYNTANLAEKYGVERFVLVSTDKAVNPTNVMGASKRMCEMIIQCRRDSATTFTAVRFGNVLGSNGSVIPLFQEQIAQGGPVTLTSNDIIRYFMTIPEASQLVMQAGAMAEKGQLFVLNMGAPVKIRDLAENLIYLSGYIPGKDIEIKVTGLRPGEKLYEELLIKTETSLTKTANDLIFVEEDTPLSRAEVEDKLALLRSAVSDAETELESPIVRNAMKQVVPTFHEAEEVNKLAAETAEMKLAAGIAVE